MKKLKKLIVGNWKMNPSTVEEAKKIAQDVKRVTPRLTKTQVVLCPPFVYISPLSGISGKNLFLGAQDAFYEGAGQFTGEVSFSELPQFNVDYVILGHSERRKMGETDSLINKKVKAVVGSRMKAIICVGENVRDNHGDYFSSIKNQILAAIKDVSKKSVEDIIIAYEPIWAIGAKEAMNPVELLETSIFIRKVLRDHYGILGDYIKILYGGSVDRVNADVLVRDGNVSGLLIGRQSLVSKDFVEIIKLIDNIK